LDSTVSNAKYFALAKSLDLSGYARPIIVFFQSTFYQKVKVNPKYLPLKELNVKDFESFRSTANNFDRGCQNQNHLRRVSTPVC
jgi:hypothetical protein